ncbi:LLM class flavin-dependent oxidoreductase [Dactylosporangium roseum]|uniref:LLM class flavin-dependent oxidoreductase n=1 Tax=Dactylosporangium roseum TaxID=47989 RepID=A0ABY5ZFH0_9ACTN|nr:MupA/Atu3671 family FMN-dependent luciferase-like monooxygenase [Dactylosporangium roseum]UWZ39423.1 LLM class flavin-dependent oxidoreductase [Dactylosporangium roseum]
MFFSGADRGRGPDRYAEILRVTGLAEELGLEAVWLPERHYHPFGGLFPDPAVLGAALAARTERIGIRAGSVVVPLHDPVGIAERWALVDALSGGRAGVSLAAGWNRGDFALARCAFEQRREYTFAAVDTLRTLWRGETVQVSGGQAVRTFPAPVRAELPLWLTATSAPDTFTEAGRRGCRVLTAFLQLDRVTLERNIRTYRTALAAHAPDRAPHVTLMLHACVAETTALAVAAAEPSLIAYQEQFLDLNDRAGGPGEPLTAAEKRELSRYSAHKYAVERGLIGGPEQAAARLEDLAGIGVDEVACLVDYGLAPQHVTETLRRLAALTS